MPDPRFYERLPPVTVGDLATLVGARVLDSGSAGRVISGVAPLASARRGDVAFCIGRRHIDELALTAAGACFVGEGQASAVPSGCAALVTPLPQAAYAAAADCLVRARRPDASAQAVHPTAVLEDDVFVSAGAVIGAGAEIGRGTVIGPGAVIGAGVAIGRDCVVGPRVVVGFTLMGDRVRIYAGAVIGEPGFGATLGPRGVIDIPQLGRVIIQDGVTVGANSCIDRTVIGENTKIDNLVQIAHNVTIGRNCVLAAHTGVSGSVVIGDGCMLGGRVGISDHITIGAGARLAAAAGVIKNVPAGESWGGTPARPMSRWMRETAMLARLTRRRPGEHGKT